MTPDRHDLQTAEYTVYHMVLAVNDVMILAHKGEEERADLYAELGNLVDARRRLDDLIFTLSQTEREAA